MIVRPWWPIVLAFAAIVVGAVDSLRFVLAVDGRPAFTGRMTIDATSYLANARAMIEAGDFVYSPDRYHSLGMSMYTALFMRTSSQGILALQLANVVLWTVAMGLVFVLGRRAFRIDVAAMVAVVGAAQSILGRRYCGIVQYEVLAMLLVATTIALARGAERDRRAAFALGIAGACLAMIRVHFALVTGFVFLDAVRVAWSSSDASDRRARVGALAAQAAAFALVLGAVVMVLSVREKAFVFVQDARSGAAWLRRLNPNATGAMWPYPEPAEPHGLAFVLRAPDLYLRFLGRKALFLIGYERDTWSLPSESARVLVRTFGVDARVANRGVAVSYASVVVLGLARIARGWSREPIELRACALSIAALLLPQVLVGSSTRLLVPFLPAFALVATRAFVVPTKAARLRGSSDSLEGSR